MPTKTIAGQNGTDGGPGRDGGDGESLSYSYNGSTADLVLSLYGGRGGAGGAGNKHLPNGGDGGVGGDATAVIQGLNLSGGGTVAVWAQGGNSGFGGAGDGGAYGAIGAGGGASVTMDDNVFRLTPPAGDDAIVSVSARQGNAASPFSLPVGPASAEVDGNTIDVTKASRLYFEADASGGDISMSHNQILGSQSGFTLMMFAGYGAAASIQVVGNKVALGAGNDLVDFEIKSASADCTVSQNRFDAGDGHDTLLLWLAAPISGKLSLDLESGKLTIGSQMNSALNFEDAQIGGLLGYDAKCHLAGDASDNQLSTSWGNDTLEGRGGADLLLGSLGADRFIYDALTDSTVAAPDRIRDFSSGDHIDLHLIDADALKAGNQAFHLGATHGHAGDIVVSFDGAQTHVDLYVDNDATADARILLDGDHTGLTAGDFIL